MKVAVTDGGEKRREDTNGEYGTASGGGGD